MHGGEGDDEDERLPEGERADFVHVDFAAGQDILLVGLALFADDPESLGALHAEWKRMPDEHAPSLSD